MSEVRVAGDSANCGGRGLRVEPRHIFVVIPAYNESRVLGATLAPLVAAGYSVVVVDDGSTDGMWQVLENLPVARIRHPINLGQGAALQTGMDFALRSGAEIVVHYDADGQHSPGEIQGLIKPIIIGEADVVLGSRFLRKSDTAAVPLARRWLLRIGSVVSGLLSGMWLSDTHNGFRALSREALSRVRLLENGFAHATEILNFIHAARLRYVEFPTTIRYTEYSRAKGQRATNAINIVFDLLLRKVLR